MAFVVPTFPSSCNIWRNATWRAGAPWTPPPAADVTADCQLRGPNHRKNSFILAYGAQFLMELCLPKGTDVRLGDFTTTPVNLYKSYEVVEVPAGSGRFYFVVDVDDVSKDFTNEYRVALLASTIHFQASFWNASYGGPFAPPWPTPYP